MEKFFFSKKGLEGKFDAARDKTNTVINFIASDNGRRSVAEDTRNCMKPYMDRIFDAILQDDKKSSSPGKKSKEESGNPTQQINNHGNAQIGGTNNTQINITKPGSTTLAVPCVDGGGSGGWMFEGLPEHYFPLGMISVDEWPLRAIEKHPMYDPKSRWNRYGTCVIVPSKYP
jgi:hypothetical protein